MWNRTDRDENLLAGTDALQEIFNLEREFTTVMPYLKMLSLSEDEVLSAFALVSSRAFGMNMDPLGGPQYSKVVPCGVDLFNHDLSADSELHWDRHFGQELHSKSDFVGEMVWKHKEYGSPKPIDWASSWFWINDEVSNGTQMFINYGRKHSSAVRLALYGFIDKVHVNDFFHLDFFSLNETQDRNAWMKRKYFRTAWNTEYVQRKRIQSMQCYIDNNHNDFESLSWSDLGRRRKHYHNTAMVEKKVLSPPLRMKYDGRRNVVVSASFLRFLRLAYLPESHFNAFTISSILNDAEYEYLEKVIDPIVLNVVHQQCRDRLSEYPTTRMQDQKALRMTYEERERLLELIDFSRYWNRTRMDEVKGRLSELDRMDLVLRYRLREKGYWIQCTRMVIEPTYQYMKVIYQKKEKRLEERLRMLRKQLDALPSIQSKV